MIAHQTIGMDLPASFRAGLAENFQETPAVDIVAKNRFPPVASIQEMVKGACVFDSDLAGHAQILTKINIAVSIVRTDPFLELGR